MAPPATTLAPNIPSGTPRVYTMTAPPKPALTPPPGVIPDFDDPFSLLPYVNLTIAGGIFITTVLTAARLYVKSRIVKKFLWEDYTGFAGYITYIVFVAIEWRCNFGGTPVHQWNMTYETLQYNLLMSNYSDMFYCITVALVKLSILLLVLRIFLSVQRNALYWLTVALIWANTLFYAIAFFIAIYGCRPRVKIWTPDMKEGQCLDSKSLYLTSATFNVFSDLAMLSVPIYLVWTLQTSSKRKWGISAIFGFGAFACTCSIVRTVFQIKLISTKDFTWVHTETGLLGFAELACGITCGALPIVPLLWHNISTTNRSHTNGISMQPVHKSGTGNHTATGTTRTARHWEEAYDNHQEVNGEWVKLDGETITPSTGAGGLEPRQDSDEQALAEAVIGGEGIREKRAKMWKTGRSG